MKKQIKAKRPALSLSKKTISNLGMPEMTNVIGGGPSKQCGTKWCDSYGHCTRSCSSG